jgi:1-deoxy-D-xylulose-5-phosphate reductoisomerase
MKGITIYGSTGSIGTQTLEVIADSKDFRLVSLVCNERIDLLEQQVRKYKPIYAGVVNPQKAEELKTRLKDTTTTVVSGLENSINICVGPGVDIVVNSTVGISGLIPTIEIIKHKKDIALANKESLVTGGELVKKLAAENNVKISPLWSRRDRDWNAMFPIDSEHSAIWQCLQGESYNNVEKIILTASGGPFRNANMDMLRTASKEQALNHPTWNMGGRITIDSATLMNKGFEVIEAVWLFGVKPEDLKVQIHPQSIIHSMVQFKDSSVKAQMGLPDMKLPIQYAINYPKRLSNQLERLDLTKSVKLEFFEPDMDKFKCLGLAFDAIKVGGTAPAVLNGADERAVALFLDRKIAFLDIADSVEKALQNHKVVKSPMLRDILTADRWARNFVDSYVKEKYKSRQISKSVS